jgi:PKHD-type hydroxylase
LAANIVRRLFLGIYMVVVIDSVLNQEEVAQLRRHIDQGDWVDGQLTAGEQAKSVKHNQQLNAEDKLTQELGDVVLDRLANTPQFIAAALPLKIFPPMVNRYQNGETYGLHVDNAVRFVPGTITRVRSDLSATLFLSSPDDYEGGELHIEEQFGSQQIKLNAGDMVLYPSRSLHRVKPVTDGSRVSVVMWMQSMVRDNEQREMLYELDQSIQQLTPQIGHQDKEIMRLTNVYQNLVRQWADT